MLLNKKRALSLTVLGAVCSFLSVANAQQGGAEYINTHGDWKVECFKEQAGVAPCQIYTQSSVKNPQKEKNANAPAEIPVLRTTIVVYEKKPAMILTSPLGVQLSEGIKLRLNENTDKGKIFITVKDQDGKNVETDIAQINYERCMEQGCIAALPLDIDESGKLVDKLKAGTNLFANFTFNEAEKDAAVKAQVSLKGFTAAYDELMSKTK